MTTDLVHRAAAWLKQPEELPFADELEPCIFYRITPKIGPIVGVMLATLTLIAVLVETLANGQVAWATAIGGTGAALLCFLLPRSAGRWPGSEALTDLEIAYEERRTVSR